MAIGDVFSTLYNTMIQFLRDNVADPTGESRVAWITSAYPPMNYTKPQVAMNLVSTPFRKDLGIGDEGEIATYRFKLAIFSSSTVYTISNVDYGGNNLLQYLASKFARALKTSRDWFTTNKTWFKDLIVLANQPIPYREGLDEYRHDITFDITVQENY